MQSQVYRSYTEDTVLELPFSRMAPRLIHSLDGFLSFITMHQPDLLMAVAGRLLELTRQALFSQSTSLCEETKENLLSTFEFRSQFPDLFNAHLTWLIELLGIPVADWIDDGLVGLSQVRFIRVRYLPNYLKLRVLVDLIGRGPAIKMMKHYLDDAIAHGPSRTDGPDSLTDLRERQVSFNLQEAGMDWTSAVISDHQYLNKVTVCRIEKTLAELGDRELMEVVACYPDFAMFRKTNESFRLTRTQTLMSGGCCCDTCYHDVRFVPDFEHPPLDVFASLPESSD